MSEEEGGDGRRAPFADGTSQEEEEERFLYLFPPSPSPPMLFLSDIGKVPNVKSRREGERGWIVRRRSGRCPSHQLKTKDDRPGRGEETEAPPPPPTSV